MIEKVATWSLGFVLLVPLFLSSYLVIVQRVSFDDYKSYWTPVLTALVAWLVKGRANV